LLITPTISPCQEIADAVELEDLGFDSRLFSAARPAALAGAYIAAGDDVHSLVYNPAGLTHLRRIETAMGFEYEKTLVESTFYGSTSDVDQTSTSLDYISIAYPFPTYRGSLVGAFGIYREYSGYLDLINRGANASTFTNDDYILQQSGSIFSYNFGCAIDLSPTLSVGVTLFFLDGTISSLTQWSYENQGPLAPGDVRQHFLLDDLEVDTDGYGGRIGVQYFPHRKIRFGVSMSSPVWITLTGNEIVEETIYKVSAPDSFTSGDFPFDLDVRLPYRFDMGLCFTPNNFLLAADFGYTDWRQSSINKTRLRNENLKPVQRETINIRIGVEYKLPHTPVQVRAGYAYTPYSTDYLQSDRINEEELNENLTKASIDKEKQIYSLGIGGLIGRVLSLDAAYQYISGERSIPTLKDARVQHRLLLSGSYRF
jgi:long-subunit fatty acid transport protein